MKAMGERSVRTLKGAATAAASFAGLGTVAALWDNPFFIRMVPAGAMEILLLAALSALLGTFVAVRRRECSVGTIGSGGVLGFLGVACPVCNQLLMMLFGGELLLTYYEPIRIYVAAAGVLIAGGAVWIEWVRRKRELSAHHRQEPPPPEALRAPARKSQ